MKNRHIYRLFLVMIFVILGHLSWGSKPLPQLTFNQLLLTAWETVVDTLPYHSPAGSVTNAETTTIVEGGIVAPTIKEVPWSRKKPRPATVAAKVAVPNKPVIKPRIVIKKISIKTP